jgi:hypothetical protein
LRRWLDAFRSFRASFEAYWNEHAVQVPQQLAKSYPDELTVLPFNAFHWPLWDAYSLQLIFRSNRPIRPAPIYANLWESMAWPYVQGMPPGDVRADISNFSWARPFVSDLPDNYGVTGAVARLRRTFLRRRKRWWRAV